MSWCRVRAPPSAHAKGMLCIGLGSNTVLRLPPRTDELAPGARSTFYPHQGDAVYRVRVQYRAAAAAQDR